MKVINASYYKFIIILTLRRTIQHIQIINSFYLNSCLLKIQSRAVHATALELIVLVLSL